MLCDTAFQEVGAWNDAAAVPPVGSIQNTSTGLNRSLGNVDNVHGNCDGQSHDHCSRKTGSALGVSRFRRLIVLVVLAAAAVTIAAIVFIIVKRARTDDLEIAGNSTIASSATVSLRVGYVADATESQGTITVTFAGANENNVFAMDSQSLIDLNSQDTPFGIWYWFGYVPGKVNKGVYPGLRGAPIILEWANLEPTQGQYSWSEAERYMASAIAEGLYFSVEVLVGPASPEWLYQKGVPEVRTTEDGWRFPYYFDPLYLESVDKFNRETVAYLKALPVDKAKAVNSVVLNDGSTGDPHCYKGEPLDSQYDISSEAWETFRQENLQSIHDYLGPDGLTKVQLAIGHVSDETRAFVDALFPNLTYFKNGMASHGYHIAEDEASVIDIQRSKAFQGNDGTRVRWFGEMDREWLNGWFQKAPAESFWWSAIYALHMGLSRWHVRGDALEVKGYHFAFDFFNKHAPHINAAASPYAFCALREGLDASDTVKFSESNFGSVVGKPLSRVMKILEKYAPYGAVVNDQSVTGSSAMRFRQRSDYVDVFYGGVRGNYHRFLYQIDPEGESIGWWHVGNNAQSPYGLFARSFDAKNNKNAMYFRLDDQFISDKSGRYAIRVSITYFDEGDGKWELLYNDPAMGMRSGASIACSNSQSWKKVQIDLSASVLNGGLDKGSDFILKYISGSDTKFHMIELDLMEPKTMALSPGLMALLLLVLGGCNL